MGRSMWEALPRASGSGCNVTYFTLPRGTSRAAIRRMEQTVMEGVKAQGVILVNRKDPEIDVPFGGYLQ